MFFLGFMPFFFFFCSGSTFFFFLWKLYVNSPLRNPFGIPYLSHFLLSWHKFSSSCTGRAQISKLFLKMKRLVGLLLTSWMLLNWNNWLRTILNQLWSSSKVSLGNTFWLWTEAQWLLHAFGDNNPNFPVSTSGCSFALALAPYGI